MNPWQKRNSEWLNSGIDVRSVSLVCNIKPNAFRKRIKAGLYDCTLNECVKGADYEVPLWYVTKVFDFLLKGALVGDYMETNEDIEDYIADYGIPPNRTLEEAMSQNDEMKSIWKDSFAIDIDSQYVDFEQFNKNFPPFVSEKESFEYFRDVPNGLCEWILCNINNPSEDIYFDYISCLMEYATFIYKVRAEWE